MRLKVFYYHVWSHCWSKHGKAFLHTQAECRKNKKRVKGANSQVGSAHKSRYIVNSNLDLEQVQALLGLSPHRVQTAFARAMFGQRDDRSYAQVVS